MAKPVRVSAYELKDLSQVPEQTNLIREPVFPPLHLDLRIDYIIRQVKVCHGPEDESGLKLLNRFRFQEPPRIGVLLRQSLALQTNFIHLLVVHVAGASKDIQRGLKNSGVEVLVVGEIVWMGDPGWLVVTARE